jgi:hypothetical protein
VLYGYTAADIVPESVVSVNGVPCWVVDMTTAVEFMISKIYFLIIGTF